MPAAGRYRLLRRCLSSAVVGGLACVVIAAPVHAFASRRSHVVTVPASPYRATFTFGSSTATCPTGQHVLFGGFDGGEAGMRRTADDRWTVYAFTVPAPNVTPSPITLTSFVYCGYGPVASKATSTVEIRYRTARPASGSATARCPAGTVVVAGGFASSPHSIVSVTGLERVAPDLWRVSAHLVLGTHTALTAVAYCGPGPAPKLVSRSIKSAVGSTARATCPVGTTLAFGGGIAENPSPFEFTYLRTLRAETRSRWSVGGYAGGPRGKLTALAYCR